MKICYCDESFGSTVAVMVGVIVDTYKMEKTKKSWQNILHKASTIANREVEEIHTSDLYTGSGPYYHVDGTKRAEVIDEIYDWFSKRQHRVVYTSVAQDTYKKVKEDGSIYKEIQDLWQYLGFHLILATQKKYPIGKSVKNKVLYVFDQGRGGTNFSKLVFDPPAWSGEYYGLKKKDNKLSQVIDAPYFADSKHACLIQAADAFSFVLRRYSEILDFGDEERYKGERERISNWVSTLEQRAIERPNIYQQINRSDVQEMFYKLAPNSIRDLGKSRK